MTTVLFYLLFVASAVVLTVVILLQEGKGGGFGDALGSAGQQAFGVKASGVQRFTMWVAIVFLGSAIAIHLFNKRAATGNLLGEDDEEDVRIEAPMGGDTGHEVLVPELR